MGSYDTSVSNRKGCNYCMKSKELPLDANYVSFNIVGDIFCFNNLGRVVQGVEINYCPVCGKKFNK